MTQGEKNAEFHYRYTERIGIICGDKPPTEAQIEQATKEAREAVAEVAYQASLQSDKAPCLNLKEHNAFPKGRW
jgi:hypothetical protein